jgi:hypothetical protein
MLLSRVKILTMGLNSSSHDVPSFGVGSVACSLLLTSLSFTLYLIPSFRSTIDQTLTVCDRTRQENGSQTSSSREGHSTFDCRSE